MWDALGHLLPLAVAGAISSVTITAAIIILLSPNQRRSSIPFLLGLVVGIGTVTFVFALFARTLPLSPNRTPQVAIGIVEIVIGIALEVLAVVEWRRRPRTPSAAEPRWLRTVGALGPWSSLALGFGLAVRPKAILLSIAAGLAISGATLTGWQFAVSLAVYTLISTSTVIALVVVALSSSKRTRPWLESTRTWIAGNGSLITVVVLAIVGVFVLGNGLIRMG
ncbi:GAP family protein [Leifsonia sp. LS-T14]|uniref:GAP family protein n=1 Tax=unclassified Leifsonia TaxID=2663824 RepID=UPI0035A58672